MAGAGCACGGPEVFRSDTRSGPNCSVYGDINLRSLYHLPRDLSIGRRAPALPAVPGILSNLRCSRTWTHYAAGCHRGCCGWLDLSGAPIGCLSRGSGFISVFERGARDRGRLRRLLVAGRRIRVYRWPCEGLAKPSMAMAEAPPSTFERIGDRLVPCALLGRRRPDGPEGASLRPAGGRWRFGGCGTLSVVLM